MDLVKLCMMAVLGVSVAVIVKQWKADFLPLLRMGLTILFGVVILTAASPLLQYVQELSALPAVSEYAEILFKAMGIAILSDICASICRECGEGGIGTGVEMVGKVELLLLSLPLIGRILSVARTLLELGG